MAAHLPTSERAQRGAALLVALAIGLVTLAMTDNHDGERALPDTTTTSAPQVLGAVVTAPPDASPAEPVPVEVPDTATTESGGSVVTPRPASATSPIRRPGTTTTALVTTSTTTSPSTDPTLIPPTYIENTTTTTSEVTTTTTEGTTTTETTETTAAP